jgi:hypothetical protein
MKLTKQEISFLAREFNNKSEISLFANINEALSGTEEAQLTAKGILSDGKMTKKAEEFFTPFAYADRCTKLMIKDSYFVVEKYSYKYKDQLVLVENRNGELDFSNLGNFEDLTQEFTEFFGQSLIKSSDVKLTLSPKELVILLGIMDIVRRKALADYIGDVSVSNLITIDTINDQLVLDKKNSLAKMIIANYTYEVPEKKDIQEVLTSLEKKGCIIKGDQIKLSNDYYQLAVSLLIPETMIVVETFQLLKNNEMLVGSALILSAGVRDMIAMVIALDEVQLSSLSGTQLNEMLKNFMSCPEIE